VQHKIGILSCSLQGLEKLAETNLITALKQNTEKQQLINVIQMLKHLYTKFPAEFSCSEDVKETILSIINNKYDVLPKLVEKYRDDFIKSVQSELKHNIACTIP
jgi:flagellar motility protein MotE (MotC chaperone)